MLDEGRVKMANRHRVIKMLSQSSDKYNWTLIKSELINQNLVSNEHADKMGDILKMKGTLKQIEDMINADKKTKKGERFKRVIEYFKSIKNYLKYFGVNEDDQGLQQGVIIFDFGLILEN